MALQAGQLLIRRMQLALAPGATDVDTGLVQANLGVNPDPPVGGVDGVTASRVMVDVLPPWPAWANLTVSEPVLDPVTKTVHVIFTNAGGTAHINVLFWDPHTLMGPVDADVYTIPSTCVGGEPPVSLQQGIGTGTFGGF